MTTPYMFGLALSTGMDRAHAAQITSYYQIQAYSSNLITQDQAMLITGYYQYDALVNMQLPFNLAVLATTGFIETALVWGIAPEIAIQVSNEGQLAASRANKEATTAGMPPYFTPQQFTQITNSAQVEGVTHANMSFAQALQISSFEQVAAFKFGLPFDQALQIVRSDQNEALKWGATFSEAIQFNTMFQIMALEQHASPHDALQFANIYQVEAYTKCHNVQEALTIQTSNAYLHYVCDLIGDNVGH